MSFRDENNNIFERDNQYALEDGETLSEYELGLLRIVSMYIPNTPSTPVVDPYYARLAYWHYEDERELAERRKLLKRRSSGNEPEAGPSKRRKLNNEASGEEGKPDTSQKRYDRSFGEVDEKSEPEAKKKKMTKDI